jgi:hypothetical protein
VQTYPQFAPGGDYSLVRLYECGHTYAIPGPDSLVKVEHPLEIRCEQCHRDEQDGCAPAAPALSADTSQRSDRLQIAGQRKLPIGREDGPGAA